MYTEEALHERLKATGNRKRRPSNGKDVTSAAGAKASNGSVHPPAPEPVAAVVDEVEHPLLAPPLPAPRRPGLIPTDIADTIGPVATRHRYQAARRDGHPQPPNRRLERCLDDRSRGHRGMLAGTIGL